jgi:hypothetical protein
MELGNVDGHGRYGLLEETGDGLVCHECGRAFPNLGLHAWRGHGTTAAQYREAHGLQRRRELVSSELRARIQTAASARMSTPAGQPPPGTRNVPKLPGSPNCRTGDRPRAPATGPPAQASAGSAPK